MAGILEKRLRQVRLRCFVNVLLEQTVRILIIAGIAAVLAVLIERLLALKVINSWTVWGLAGAGAAAVIFLWIYRLPGRMQTSILLDGRMKLKERFSTAFALAKTEDDFAKAACAEAKEKARTINPKKYFPIEFSRKWFYGAGIWCTAAILLMYLPQKDLLGFMRRKLQDQQQKIAIELAQKDIEQAASSVKTVVENLGDPKLDAEAAKLADLTKAGEPEAARREAIKKLGDIADSVKQMQSGLQPGSMEVMQSMLKQLRGSQGDVSQKLRNALASGKFGDAQTFLKELQKKLEEGNLSDEQRKALAEQLQKLGKELEQLAEKNKELEKELEKLGLDKELAKLSEEQLKKVLQNKNVSPEMMEQLMQKMQACKSACSRCSGLGKSIGSCGMGAGGLSGDELAEAMEQLGELDTLQQQMKLSEATLAEIERAIACLGEGMCQGIGKGPFREGESNKFSRGTGGPGKGFGEVDADKEGDTSTSQTRAKGKTDEGAVIASWYFKGTQIKGEAQREFSEVVQSGRDRAAEAISENRIPKKYEESVKKYFDQVEGTIDSNSN